MECLWSASGALTVREVHASVAVKRNLAYTTIMTVLQRLAKKNLVVQRRDNRAHRYVPKQGRAELVAELMSYALDQVAEKIGQQVRVLTISREPVQEISKA